MTENQGISIEAIRHHRGSYREDLGDLDALAKSIDTLGMIQPIVIDQRSFLLSGKRRLEAVRKLGHKAIPVIVVADLDQAHDVMTAQLLEPTERKDPVPSEKVAQAGALVNVMPKRRAPAGEGRGRAGHRNEYRTKLAESVGLSRSSYYYASQIVAEAVQGNETAVLALKEMDATGMIRPFYDQMRSGEVKPHAIPQGGRSVRQVRSSKPMEKRLVESVAQLRGLTTGLDSVVADDLTDVDATVRRRLETELRQSVTRVNRLRKLLKGQGND